MNTGNVRGRFLWHELRTTEPDEAVEFYSDVVGWQVEGAEPAGSPYVKFVRGGTPRAGLSPLPGEDPEKGAPPHWLGHVGVSDTDGVYAEAVGLGATGLAEPTDVPTLGRVAVLRDPEGAAFALVTPAEGQDRQPGFPPGSFTWHELPATDLDGAFEFYAALFGWCETRTFDMGEMGPYRIFGIADVELGGFYRMPRERPGPPSWLAYIRVEAVEEAVDRVAEGGGTVLSGPMEVPGGDVVAQCVDPAGASFALHEIREEEGDSRGP